MINKNQEILKHIEIPDWNLNTLFRNNLKDNKDKNVIYFKGKFKTYKELDEEINRLANSLKKLGIKKQDRVAVLLPNCPQLYSIFFAVQSLGSIFIALNPLYSSHEIKHLLNDCKPKIFLTLDIFLEKIKPIQNEISIEKIIITSIADELPAKTKYIYKLMIAGKKTKIEKTISYKSLLSSGENKKIEVNINPEEDIAVLQYTGGTTGVPKGAMLTHKNLISQSIIIKYWKSLLEKQPEGQLKLAGILPFSHIFGLTSSFIFPIAEGATTFLVPDPRKLEEIMILIQKYKIQFLFCVPILFQKLGSHKLINKYDLSSLILCISGGETLPEKTVTLFEGKTNCLLVEGYGLSEASPVTHINPPNKKNRKIGSIGVTIPNTLAKIVDIKTGEKIITNDKDGELWVKGPGIMKGYWKNEKATNETIVNGWLKTGDIVTKDKDDYYKVVDRLKDVILVSGYNVFPSEVEKILLLHDSILETAVIANNTDNGSIVKAIIVLKPECEKLSNDELKSFCKNYLAPYKIPKIIEYKTELPRSMTGKILRRKLKEDH
jgi:long-chain acyl-CoA synthetase